MALEMLLDYLSFGLKKKQVKNLVICTITYITKYTNLEQILGNRIKNPLKRLIYYYQFL